MLPICLFNTVITPLIYKVVGKVYYRNERIFRNRYTLLMIVAGLLAAVLVFQVVNLQMINGEYYTAVANSRGYATKRIDAPRGEIVDKYGRVIAGNTTIQVISIEDTGLKNARLNEVLFNLLELAKRIERPYTDSLPLSVDEPVSFTFETEESELKWKETWKFDEDETAEEVYSFLIEKYGIEGYSNSDTRAIMGIRFDMRKNNFGSKSSFEFLRDVDIAVVSEIKENREKFAGVAVETVPARDYPLGTVAAHTLGYIGLINETEYEELKEKGYGMQDYVGKTGLEKYLEPELKGKDGKTGITIEVNGKTTVVNEDVPAIPGNRVMLTMDMDMQMAAEQALENAIEEIKINTEGNFTGGGAAVAIDISTGAVLAIASYPGYNPASFNKDYNTLINDKNNPIYNRAMGGTYSPGSTFKPLVALAGLQEGVITPGELIDCTGRYQYYAPSYTPACWIYGYYGGNHGYLNVEGAIENSCNIYFFETGRRLKIETISKYAEMFGFGKPTGIEISGESAGMVASPQNREELNGGDWYPADTIQAAIGQSDNKFTILQLANYCAAIANKGTLYKPYIIRRSYSGESGEIVSETKSQVLSKIEIDDKNWNVVHRGMRSVVATGSTAPVFEDAPYSVAGKTGTAQTSSSKNDSLFIAFAPYDNPQVAVACIIENGGILGEGNQVVTVARKIFDSYFAEGDANDNSLEYNTLLE